MKKYIVCIATLFVSFIALSQTVDRYEIKHLSDINTKYSDFGVAYYGDDQVVFASSRKVRSLRNRTWANNSQPFLNLYQGNKTENGEILDIELFSSKINTKYHESNAVFAADLKTVYFTRNNYFDRKYKKDEDGMNNLKLYRAHINEKGLWGDIEDLSFNNDSYSVGHPSLSSDGKMLYFISDMPGGLGKTDIYYVHLLEDGTYGEPINAGPTVNTMNREMFPFLSKKGILYFSSDGRSGLGSLDIYKSVVSDGGTVYSNSESLESPVNSVWDDFAFTLNEKDSTGYFSSNRDGGKGDDDIYFFKETITGVQYVKGIIKDDGIGDLIPGVLVSLYKDNVEIEKVITGNDGGFSFTVDCGSNYTILGTKKGYIDFSKDFVTSNEDQLEIELVIELKDEDIVEIDGIDFININPIYFDLEKAIIRPDATIELQKVITVMKRYPQMIVQLGSHTDSRNTNTYNDALSSRRAASSLEYIVSRGIDRTRIFGFGYGETQLVNACTDGVKCSEEEHQLNRRTEFVIIRYN
jgi:outer membrane protein OmpA-like peptidoglycan-associated protein